MSENHETIVRVVRTARDLMSKARTDEALRALAADDLGSAFQSAGIDDDASGYAYQFDVESGEQRLTTNGASSMAYIFSAAGEIRVEPLHRDDPEELSDDELLKAAGGSTYFDKQVAAATMCLGGSVDGKILPRSCVNDIKVCRCNSAANIQVWPCYYPEMFDFKVPCEST